eukprot:PhF_6_TR44122/c0_g2_i1/m.67360
MKMPKAGVPDEPFEVVQFFPIEVKARVLMYEKHEFRVPTPDANPKDQSEVSTLITHIEPLANVYYRIGIDHDPFAMATTANRTVAVARIHGIGKLPAGETTDVVLQLFQEAFTEPGQGELISCLQGNIIAVFAT